MTSIWKETGFVDNDPWVIETDERKSGEGETPVLALATFLERVEESNEGGFGVLIAPADDVTKLAPYLDRIALVALVFPAFSDGRAFSHASILRGRLGYPGEMRAVGDILIDPIPLMLRSGFDSFAVTNEVARRRLAEGQLPGIADHYQPAARVTIAPGGYSWRRTSRTAG